MAPKRAKAAVSDDNDDSSHKPTWDSSERNLQLYLLPLKRWLPRQHPQLNNFLRFGYIMNSKQEAVVYDNDHKDLLKSGNFQAGTFESPWFHHTSLEGERSSDEDSEASLGSSAAARVPLSTKKIKRPTDQKTIVEIIKQIFIGEEGTETLH